MKILKFGGKSLANGTPIKASLELIKKASQKSAIAVVVSARGGNTDSLIEISKRASQKLPFTRELNELFEYHKSQIPGLSLEKEYSEIYELLRSINTIGILNDQILDQVVAYGEIISAKGIAHLLSGIGYSSVPIDSRKLIKTDSINQKEIVNWKVSEQTTKDFFQDFNFKTIPIITGYISSDLSGRTTTLGRNGSNYTATLIANFLDAEEVQNWTNIDGFYTANPLYVKNAKQIHHLTYKEANELALFGANILHSKTIQPLVKKEIPIRILNSFAPEKPGTLIDKNEGLKGIKSVNAIENCSLISIEGKGLIGRVGIDAKIFNCISNNSISVRVISQASSERNIGFVVDEEDALFAKQILEQEFSYEIEQAIISSIQINSDIAIIAITGRHNYALEKAISGLRKNKIWLHLIANSISGEHISLVVQKPKLRKALNVVHNHVFGGLKTLNVFAFGKGTVGKAFIDQVLSTSISLAERRKLDVKIIGVADSKGFIINPDGITENWISQLKIKSTRNNLETIIEKLHDSDLENIVIVDNTANRDLAFEYDKIAKEGFDIIASNKIANTLPIEHYNQLRSTLENKNRNFFYETNVGAGLPVIDTVKQLVNSDEKITKISGVFSGSLSYIFNIFSEENIKFSEVVESAKSKGFTEPDPREDLEGNDVARKLLILAREIGLNKNLDDITVENLVPEQLRTEGTWEEFITSKEILDETYQKIKNNLNENEVLRYVGSLDQQGKMTVSLETHSQGQPLANLKGSDSIIEIYTESYGDKPIIIQGAGAGAQVTARGVYSDLVRLGNLQ